MPLVTYSLLRLGLFGLCLAGLVAAGMGSWLAVVIAAFLAWGISYVLLERPRDAAARYVADRVQAQARRSGLSRRQQDDAAAEDAEAVATHADEPAARPDPGHSASPRPSSTP